MFDDLRVHIRSHTPTGTQGIATADDVLQQTMTQAFLNIDQLKCDSFAGFQAWIKSIAERQATDLLRHQLRLKRGGGRVRVSTDLANDSQRILDAIVANDSTASRKLSRKEEQQRLAIAMAQLPPVYRSALESRYLDEHSLSEVAEEIGKSEGATRGILERAREQLRKLLKA
jgi:RNA polymerase sigma-70 factor (ECF subfamily)